ncbi:MAG: VanW family protein [Chloroflexota bacterium]
MRKNSGAGALIVLGLLVALVIGGAALYEGSHVGSIYPGIRIGGQDVGNLSRAQAADKLQQTLDSVSAHQVQVTYGGRQWTTTFADLGLRYDVSGSVDAAYAIGRQTNPLARLGDQFVAPLTAPEVVPTYTLDDAKLQSFVRSLATAIDHPLRDAGVQLHGSQLTVTAAQDGRQLDQANATAQLRSRVAQLSSAPVALKVNLTAPATGNGDVADAIAQARRWVSTSLTLETPIGSTVMPMAQIASLVHLTQPAGKGPVKASLDSAALRTMLGPLAEQIKQPAHDATFVITDGALAINKPGQDGRSLDLDAAVAAVTAAIEAGQGVLRLPVQVVQPDLFSLEDAADVQQRVAQLAGKAMTVQATNKSWALSPKDLSAMLQLTTTQHEGRTRLALTVQTDQATALMQKIADEIDQPAQNARFQWANGALKVTAPSQDGHAVDQVAAAKALLDGMQSTQRTVVLPVTVLKPAVSGDHPEALGIKELVAQGTSNFEGSPPERIQNIERGAQLIDGAVIAPGQIFSFDDTVGDISLTNGFTTGLVILDHETKDGVGGGICQVSTTLFRAAFYAGLPIVERHDHAYAVPYYTQGGYPDGFDATIYSPQLDLKFKNDTSTVLLIQTAVDVPTNTMTVSFYGTKAGRVVQLIPGPISNRVPHPADLRKLDSTLPKGVIKQVDWAHDGFDTWIKRVVTVNGKVAGTDVFNSHLQPWQAVYLIGTGTATVAPSTKP